ncbi:MAG: guanylate kinase [Alphaproteobacteria bacterium]|nr:MAG: guanylate kinase [Alphaproteobacteria bacterium]
MSKPININRRGLMLVLSSPSGAGKTTLARQLLADDEAIAMSVSVTTRAARPGEVEGEDYIFVDRTEYDRRVDANEFLEHAQVFDHFYGTPTAAVYGSLEDGMDVLFDIDWQGTQQLQENAPNDLVKVFILPPSNTELERRLRSRAQDSEDVVKSRMSQAATEISHWPEYDYIIINEDVADSLQQLKAILAAERLRRARQTGLSEFVTGNF